jgi:hypothetical protein
MWAAKNGIITVYALIHARSMATNGPGHTLFRRMSQSSTPPWPGKVTHYMFYGVKREQLPYAQDVLSSTADHVMQIHSYFSILSYSRI